jgi:hypothetical protein
VSKAKKQVVHVCLYSHKHGVDVGVYKTAKALEDGVLNVMDNRVDIDWHDEDKAKYRKLRSFNNKLGLFRDVEKNISYGETLELFERELEG